eukprot:6190664-Pleurochrysis_carterae.AAC.2
MTWKHRNSGNTKRRGSHGNDTKETAATRGRAGTSYKGQPECSALVFFLHNRPVVALPPSPPSASLPAERAPAGSCPRAA